MIGSLQFTFLLLIVQMMIALLTHALLALVVWFIAKRTKQHKNDLPRMTLKRQVNFAYVKADQIHKKRKGKKGKRKHKKQEYIQILNCEDNQNHEQNRHEESDKEQSEKDEKELKMADNAEVTQSLDFQANIREQSLQATEAALQVKGEDEHEVQSLIDSPENQLSQVQNKIEGKAEIELEKKQEEDRQSIKAKVIEEIELIRNYFMHQLEEVVPYNGHYGHYKLNIEGSKKSLCAQWKYTPTYPKELVNIQIKRQHLNPLELQILQHIFKQNLEKFQTIDNYFYIFNLTTSIFQDLMISINQGQEEQKSEMQSELPLLRSQTEINPQFDLKMVHVAPEDIKIKKEIYGKILDEIFYLHDMVEKPDNSAMKIIQNDEPLQPKESNTRGRYETQFQELQLIGEGGFGKVYKVRHKLDGNIYAIKKAVVNYDDFNDRKMLKEVALLSKLNHPNIVRYYQSWLEDTHSMQELKQDMSFSEREQSKIEELNHIYAKWKDEKCDIRFGNNNSEGSYEGSLVENSGIVFEYEDEDSGIVFEDNGENMSMSDGSSINHTGIHVKNESQSSLIEGFKGFPFKILYIAMELCTGINLREFINHHFEEEEHKIQILRGILEGLAYIHSKKIMHRDLKPANIFLTDQNKVKIGDFGLATTEERSVSISLESDESDFLGDKTKAVGTGYYRAPQQLKSQKYDEKVDIYSLGIIMFQLFYKFYTAMQRMETLKELTCSHILPKEFQGAHVGTDLLENIQICLQELPEKRPSASKLLQGFRNKYFTQLVSCIANPKHFQFSQLLNHLFAIKNEHGAVLMRRDAYKAYVTQKIMKIYHIHRATHFPTLPLISIQDYNSLNGQRIKINRNGKYLLLTNRGVILEYASNSLKAWLIYARDAMRKKKGLSLGEQREGIRRYTFQKIVNWQNSQHNEDKQLQYSEKMVTAFDLAYKLQDGFNPFYFCEALKISESIVFTLNLTQKRPPIYLSHSHMYSLLAKKYKISTQLLYQTLLSINGDQFYAMPNAKRVSYLQERNLPNNFCKKISLLLDEVFDSGFELLDAIQAEKETQIYEQIIFHINSIEKVKKRIVSNPVRWRLGIPSSNCNGFFWEVGIVKGLTTIEEFAPNQELCNYHIETNLDQDFEEPDVSLWCIGEYLQEEMHRMILECWKNGLTTQWYEWQVGQKQDRCRHNIILRRKNERVQVMLRHNEQKKGDHREDRESSFISFDQFNMEVIKQMSPTHQLFYH